MACVVLALGPPGWSWCRLGKPCCHSGAQPGIGASQCFPVRPRAGPCSAGGRGGLWVLPLPLSGILRSIAAGWATRRASPWAGQHALSWVPASW